MLTEMELMRVSRWVDSNYQFYGSYYGRQHSQWQGADPRYAAYLPADFRREAEFDEAQMACSSTAYSESPASARRSGGYSQGVQRAIGVALRCGQGYHHKFLDVCRLVSATHLGGQWP